MIVRLRFLTLVLDFILLLVAFSLAYFVRVRFVFSSDFPFSPYFWTSLSAAAVWILFLLIFRGYNPSVRFTRPIHIIKVVVAGLTGTALFGLFFYFGQKEFFSRLLLVYIFLFGTFLMVIFHLFMQWIERRLILMGYGIIRVLFIGSNRGVKSFVEELQRHVSPYIPVAILDGYGTKKKELLGVPILGKLNILEETIDEYHVDAIIQGDNVEQVVNIVHFCEKNDLDYYLLPYLLGVYQDSLRIQMIEKPVIAPERKGHRSWYEKLLS